MVASGGETANSISVTEKVGQIMALLEGSFLFKPRTLVPSTSKYRIREAFNTHITELMVR